MTEHGELTDETRTEMYREFHAEHLRRQTKAIETIRTILVVWAVLTAVGLFFLIVANASQSASGF